MKTNLPRLFPLITLILLTLSCFSHAETFKWKDAKGNTQYGDTPPSNVHAVPVSLPKIMVVDNYADQWKPMNFDQAQSPVKQSTPTTTKSHTSNTYKQLRFLAPKANQGIRANDGDVSAMISIKPALKKGHFIQFSIDGKASKKGKARTINFSNLNRGNHSIGVKIIDNKGATLKQSTVTFTVLRASKLNEADNKRLGTQKFKHAKTYEAAKKEFYSQ